MNVAQMIRDLRNELRAYVESALLDLFSYTKVSKPSKNGRDDKVDGRISEGSESKAESDVQRMQHFGFRSVPPVGTWSVSAKVGGQKFTLGEDSTKYAPTDVEEGELALFNTQSGVRVKLTKDGDVLIDAKDARDIIFNNGDKKVARVDDTANGGTLIFVPGTGGATLQYVAPGGAMPDPMPPGASTIDLSAVIDSGAPHVLA